MEIKRYIEENNMEEIKPNILWQAVIKQKVIVLTAQQKKHKQVTATCI